MRNLPIYIVLDVSESMAGDAMRHLEDGLQRLSDTLKTIPEALESARVSIIAFAGKAKVVTPMVEVAQLYPPRLPVGGGTALGAALDLLMERIERDVTRAGNGRKGDWKPLVFLMTDGVPTDDPSAALERWRATHAGRASLIAVSIGARADLGCLRAIADKVVILNDAADSAFRGMIDWVTQSIAIHSQSVGLQSAGGVSLSKDMPAALAEDDGRQAGAPDDRFVVIVGKCERTERPYLLKYEKSLRYPETYEFSAAVPVTQEYFELSSPGGSFHEISGHGLAGGSGCPQCPNQAALARCGQCQGVHCLDASTLSAICPWCGKEGHYVAAGEGTDFSLTRGLG